MGPAREEDRREVRIAARSTAAEYKWIGKENTVGEPSLELIIRNREVRRLDPSIIAGFSGLDDLTGATSDAMDKLGLVGAIPASVLAPQVPGGTIVGQAVTLRNEPLQVNSFEAATKGKSRLSLNEAHDIARPGDVLVVQGVEGISSMGGNSARIGRHAGEIGAVVDGGVRDIKHARDIGYPIWARGVTPITGKWRVRGAEINGVVAICGVTVNAGDLVVADECGVCFVPFEHARAVLDLAEKISANDAAMLRDVGVRRVDLDKA